ncbi:uncharacterized protein LOC144135214 [Amblyomma americanum]
MAGPAFGAPIDVANPEMDTSEEENWPEGDDDEYEDEDGIEDEMRNEIKTISYQICQVISTLIISISCILAFYGVERSLESRRDGDSALPTQVLSQLKLWYPAIVIPALFLTLPESLGFMRQNKCFFVVCAILVAPFVFLPLLLPTPCFGPDATDKPLPRRRPTTDGALGNDLYSLLAWTFWYGPVLLISIISAIKLFRTANMVALQPELQEPAPPEESGLLRDRTRG